MINKPGKRIRYYKLVPIIVGLIFVSSFFFQSATSLSGGQLLTLILLLISLVPLLLMPKSFVIDQTDDQTSVQNANAQSRALNILQRNAQFIAVSWSFPLNKLVIPAGSLQYIGLKNTPSGASELFAEEQQDLKSALLATLESMVFTKSSVDITFAHVDAYLQLTADIIRDETDNPQYLHGVIKNVSDQHELEKSLAETTNRLKAILDFAGDGIWGIDEEGKTIFVNEMVCQMTGYLPNELIGKRSHDIVHHSYSDGCAYPREKCPIYAAFTHGKTYKIDNEVFWRKDGTPFPVEYVSTPIEQDGQVKGAVVVCRDISERKTALDELNKIRHEFELLLESADIGIYGVDEDYKITFVNHASTALTGWEKEEVIGEIQHNVFHHSYEDGSPYPTAMCPIAQSIRENITISNDTEVFWRKDGSCFHVDYRCTPMSLDGKAKGAVIVFKDISEQRRHFKELEQALIDNQQLQDQLCQENTKLTEITAQLSLILESTHEGIYGLDTEGITTFANMATEKLTGWTQTEIVGHSQHALIHHSHKDGSKYEVHDCPIYNALQTGSKAHQSDEFFWRKDGTSFPVEYTSSPLINNGKVEGSVVLFRDISERKQAEENLKEAYSEIDRLNQKLEAENVYLREEIETVHHFEEIIGNSPAVKKVLNSVEQVGDTSSNVLVLGESGTGKELIARAIHRLSSRADQPLIKVNCAAFQSSLIENELFGHEKEAFTGATSRKIGRFELANNGTLFLDEIGEMSLEVQAKILRAIQEGEIERLGGSTTIKVNTRVIAATNRDLEAEVANGTFREDLFYRLNVFPITLPPLREREDDVLMLANYFIDKFNKELGRNIQSIPESVIDQMLKYSWPGNVRELQNVIERAVIVSHSEKLELKESLLGSQYESRSSSISQRLEDVERNHIAKILNQTAWKIEGTSGAAKLLGMNPSTLRSRIKKLKIQKR